MSVSLAAAPALWGQRKGQQVANRKGPRKRSPSSSRYHRRGLRDARRMGDYTQAGPVTIRKADTGEVIGQQAAYDDVTHEAITARGNRSSDPSRRAKKRRNHT